MHFAVLSNLFVALLFSAVLVLRVVVLRSVVLSILRSVVVLSSVSSGCIGGGVLRLSGIYLRGYTYEWHRYSRWEYRVLLPENGTAQRSHPSKTFMGTCRHNHEHPAVGCEARMRLVLLHA